MQKIMGRMRSGPPDQIAGHEVARVRDYLSLMEHAPGGTAKPFAGPKGDMVMLDLAKPGNYIAVRPSGTEPKIKLYMFTYEPAEQIANLEDTRQECDSRLEAIARDLSAFAAAK
jgi:phosphoglucomutase/phosphomannomutase